MKKRLASGQVRLGRETETARLFFSREKIKKREVWWPKDYFFEEKVFFKNKIILPKTLTSAKLFWLHKPKTR